MKSKLIILVSLFLFVTFFPAAFAQTVPGGGGEELVYSFKSNNGNGLNCGGEAQIKVAFNPMPDPDHIPPIKEIWYDDGKSKNQITTITTPVYGEMTNKNQPYINYCLTGLIPGSSQGNINPAIKLMLVFDTK